MVWCVSKNWKKDVKRKANPEAIDWGSSYRLLAKNKDNISVHSDRPEMLTIPGYEIIKNENDEIHKKKKNKRSNS